MKKANIKRHTTHTSPQHFDNLNYTKHAQDRIQQRSIKPEWIDLILEYGREAYQKRRHSYSIALDKKGVTKIKQHYGNTYDINKLRSIYLILSADCHLITCAYR